MNILGSYQEVQKLNTGMSQIHSAEFAIIGTFDSVLHKATLIFPGENVESQKYYCCNSAFSFVQGQKVKVRKVSGKTYIVEYPIDGPLEK